MNIRPARFDLPFADRLTQPTATEAKQVNASLLSNALFSGD
jgi:hypothetical protein